MSNNWKYATLTQRERLDAIRGGNKDVYNSEKRRNSTLREQRKALGLSYGDIDSWDEIIDSASFSADDPYRVNRDKSAPTFLNSRESELTNALNSVIKELNSRAKKDRNDAIEKALSAEKYITEWLVNNGYNTDGNKVTKESTKIQNDLEEDLDDIEKNRKNKISSAREKYLKAL